jgi:hypothetical protein|tara:strand:- start:192 stop:452 length:261 start_codon:yes stop_codon:yes gene_type:complete
MKIKKCEEISILMFLVLALFIIPSLVFSLQDSNADGFCEDDPPDCAVDRCPGIVEGILDDYGCSCKEKADSILIDRVGFVVVLGKK